MNKYNELAKDMSVTTKNITSSADEWLRQGKSVAETNELIKDSVILAKVGQIDEAEATKYLTSAMNGFKTETSDVIGIVDKLTNVDLESATSAGGLAEAMSKCANSADVAGVSMDALIGYIATVAEVTQKSDSVVGESFKTILARMGKIKLNNWIDEDGKDISGEINDVEKTLAQFDIKLRKSATEFRNFEDVIYDVGMAWDKFSSVDQNAIANAFGGVYQRENVITLFENFNRALELSEVSANSAGTAYQKFEVYENSLEAATNRLTAAFESLAYNTINSDFLTGLANATAGIVEFVDNAKLIQTGLTATLFTGVISGLVALGARMIVVRNNITQFTQAMNLSRSSTAMIGAQYNALENSVRGLTEAQLRLVLSSRQLTEAQRLDLMQDAGIEQARQRQLLQTWNLTNATNAQTAATFSLRGAWEGLKASIATNPIGLIVTALTLATTAVVTYNQKQEEARQEIKETADKAKELTDNINELYNAYADMKIGVENGTESKENLTIATNNLLEALGYEGEAVDELINKYGTLSNAINQATADRLKNSLPDLADAVDVELSELTEKALNHDEGLHFGFDITADDQESKELLNFIKEYDKENGGVEFQVVNSLTTRIDFEGDRNSAEGIKKRLENMKALRQALFDKYGAESVQDLDIYDNISSRIAKLENAYSEYDTALDEYNDTAAKAQVIQSLIGKEIPQTVDEYKQYRQELIKSAQVSDQYIGSQEDITNAIDGTLAKMSEFEDIRKRADNIDTAYSLFGIDNNVNSASEGMKKAFVDALSDDELSVLVQLDKSEFDKGIDNVKQAIEDFNSKSDNTVKAETDTSSLDDLKKAYENVSKSADSFIKNQKSLKSVLDEQEKHGQLSASTIRELSEAGYSEALVTDKVTGAVTLDMQAYERLNAQKQEKIRLDLVNEKNSLEDKLKDEETAVSDLRQEYEALAKADMEANAGRLSEITLELAKRGANIEDIRGLISQINGDITSLTAPSFENDNTDKNKEAFDKLYSQWNHDLEMNRVTQDEYINWLDGAYKHYFSDLTKYQDEYNKYEEEVYKYRTDREQKLFDKKIDNLEKLADKALDSYKDGDGNELTVTASFDYARDQINKAIAETQTRINGIKNGTISGNTDDIETLIDDLDSLNDKLIDINKKEIESEKDYISELKDDYSDMMDERIDKVDELSDKIEDSYDKQIDALEKIKDTEDRIKKIKDAQLEIKEKEKALDEAKREDAKNSYVYFDGAGMSVQTSTENQQKAQQELEESRKDLEEAYREEEINVLKEQKEAATTYYDNVKDNLEKQKTQGEKTYEAVEKIYEQLGGDKKQTSSNVELVKKLSKSGDISKAMSELSDTERQKIIDTGVVKVQPNGDYAFNYSAFAKYSSTVDNNTLATQDLTSILKEVVAQADADKDKTDNSMVAGGFNLVADPKTGKLTKKQVMVNGEVVEGLGHKVNATSKEEWQEHNNSEKTKKGSFAGYDTFFDFMMAVNAGKVDISPLTNAFNSDYNPIVDKMNKSMSDTINNVSNSNVNNNINNKPAVNLTVNVEGSADKKTVDKIKTEVGTMLIDYTNYMSSSMTTAIFRQKNKS